MRVSQWQLPAAVLTVDGDRELYFWCKRCLDVMLSVALIALVLPLALVIAASIKLDSAGPVFFVQERVGTRRRSEGRRTSWEIRNFHIYKFRSMAANVDQSLHEAHIRAYVHGHLTPASDNAKFKLANDPRVTRAGRVLRRTSLDELPQLLNVLRGEMSLVGPRPVPPYEVAEYGEADRARLAALPGITGLWQVKGRAAVSFAEMVEMDRQYVRNQSLWLDLKILAATVPVVVTGRGAN